MYSGCESKTLYHIFWGADERFRPARIRRRLGARCEAPHLDFPGIALAINQGYHARFDGVVFLFEFERFRVEGNMVSF